MSSLAFAYFWCTVQVTVLTIASLIVMGILIRRQPEVAATTAAWAACISLVLTVLVPVRSPEWLSLAKPNTTMFTHGDRSSVGTNQFAESSLDQQNAPATLKIPFELQSLTNPAAELRHSFASLGRVGGLVLAIGLSLGTLVCFARLILGLLLLRSLLRRAEPIHDEELRRLATTMLQIAGYSRDISFAQSAEISCAAVAGFLRPTILLSRQWPCWTHDELRAVLAHELAHLCRRDTCWRLAASTCSSIHFYNPLLKWLSERMVLAQELAADKLAINMTGGVRLYLRSLALLAMRHDTGLCVQPHLTLTPVFSGHLMRRIEMLRAMDCKQNRSPGRWLPAFLSVSFVMFGMTTTLLRCLAQTGAVERSNAASDADTHDTTDTNALSSRGSAPVFFTREKLLASHPVLSETGGGHVNISALKQSLFWPCVEATILEGLKRHELTRSWDLNTLDSISYDIAISTLKNQVQVEDQKHDQIVLGSTRAFVRTNREFDWKTAIQNWSPQSLASTRSGEEYLEVAFPSLGPLPLRLRPVSRRELACWIGVPVTRTGGVDADRWYLKSETRSQRKWSDEWNAVSGGVFAIAFVPPKSLSQTSLEKSPGAEQFKTICDGIDFVSFGIDFSPDWKTSAVKLRLRCKDSVEHQKVLDAGQQLQVLFKAEAMKLPTTPEYAVFKRVICDAVENVKIRAIPGNPNVIECNLLLEISQELISALNGKPDSRILTQ